MTACKQKKDSADLRLQIVFLEAVRRRCPDDIPAIKALAELYTENGQHTEGLDLDLELSRVCPAEPLVWYNLACSHAVLGQKDEALRALTQAVDLGYRDFSWMRRDQDLESLRSDRRFRDLLQRRDA